MMDLEQVIPWAQAKWLDSNLTTHDQNSGSNSARLPDKITGRKR